MIIKDKLYFEWERFFHDSMRTSKENIFANSDEITAKKRIVECIKKLLPSLNEEVKDKLEAQPNILESAYRYTVDVKRMKDIKIRAAVKEWLTKL